MSTLKLAYIGGGSREWARKLFSDLSLDDGPGGEVALYDLDEAAARLNAEYAARLLGRSPSKWRVSAVAAPEQALRGADFVVMSILPGSYDQMEAELKASADQGLLYPVGDSAGPAGLSRGVRSAAIYSAYARLFERHCPGAWIVNLTNPMALCLGALKKEAPALKLVGVCHEVAHVAGALMATAKAAGLEPPEHYGQLSFSSWGLNHCTFIDRASLGGTELLPLWLEGFRAKGGFEAHTKASIAARDDYFRSEDRVKAFVLESLGVLPSAGDRHLVEFLPGYLRSASELERYGVARTPVSFRRERALASERKARDFLTGARPVLGEPSGEIVLPLIQALSGQKELRASFVLPNEGQLPFLPRGSMVETMAQVSARGLAPERAPLPPPYLARLLEGHGASYAKTLDYVWSERDSDLIEALLLDPAAGLSPERAGELALRIKEINRPWLQSRDAAGLAV